MIISFLKILLKNNKLKDKRYLTACFLISLLIYFTAISQATISMFRYIFNVSASDVNMPYIVEINIYAILTVILFVPFQILCAFVRIKKVLCGLIITLINICIWYYLINRTIFIDRCAAWSTFMENEILFYVFYYSIIPVIVFSIMLFSGIVLVLKNYEKY